MQKADLFQFFGAWFHQDWGLDANSWQTVARQFAKADGASAALSVADSILVLVESEPNDSTLAAELSALGCEYHPETAAHTRPWLVALAHELRRAAGG